MLHRRIFSLALVTVALAGCASTSKPVSLADVLAKTPSLSTFNELANKAGLSASLQGVGPLTVFAPSNEAFSKVNAKTMDDLNKHPEKLKDVLNYHLVAEKLGAAQIKNSSVKTLNGASLALAKAGDFVTVEDAMAQQADIQASNGVIHVIDSVLIPPVKK